MQLTPEIDSKINSYQESITDYFKDNTLNELYIKKIKEEKLFNSFQEIEKTTNYKTIKEFFKKVDPSFNFLIENFFKKAQKVSNKSKNHLKKMKFNPEIIDKLSNDLFIHRCNQLIDNYFKLFPLQPQNFMIRKIIKNAEKLEPLDFKALKKIAYHLYTGPKTINKDKMENDLIKDHMNVISNINHLQYHWIGHHPYLTKEESLSIYVDYIKKSLRIKTLELKKVSILEINNFTKYEKIINLADKIIKKQKYNRIEIKGLRKELLTQIEKNIKNNEKIFKKLTTDPEIQKTERKHLSYRLPQILVLRPKSLPKEVLNELKEEGLLDHTYNKISEWVSSEDGKPPYKNYHSNYHDIEIKYTNDQETLSFLR